MLLCRAPDLISPLPPLHLLPCLPAGLCPLMPPAVAAVNVYLPKDRVTNAHQGYGFVEFKGEEDADYVRGQQHAARMGQPAAECAYVCV